MYSQYYPALAKYSDDTTEKRIEWFKQCLNAISEINNIKNKTIAFPFNIGCGAAGGDWEIYYNLIEEFANKGEIHVTLYKFDKKN